MAHGPSSRSGRLGRPDPHALGVPERNIQAYAFCRQCFTYRRERNYGLAAVFHRVCASALEVLFRPRVVFQLALSAMPLSAVHVRPRDAPRNEMHTSHRQGCEKSSIVKVIPLTADLRSRRGAAPNCARSNVLLCANSVAWK